MAHSGKTHKSPFDRVDECIQNLQDRHGYWPKQITRSPVTREAAMAGIVGELEEGHLPLEALDIRCLTIFALCGASIKKGSPKEARLAYRATGLLLLTLRDGSPGPLLDEAFPTLSKAIHDDDAPPALVAAAIDCLAAATLAGARHVEEAMKAIWRVVECPTRSRSAKLKTRGASSETTSPVVLAAAVSAWTFLLTTVTSTVGTQRKPDHAGWNSTTASLAELLDADDRRVRMASGQALAVCAELNFLTGKDMDALAGKVSDLAAESAGGKGADNSLLREQKELFGQIAAFLDHGESPVASWEWTDMMKVSTWARLAQLNFLRKFLGNGFLNHVQGNPVLKEAFSFGRVEGKPLSIQNKESIPIDGFLRDLKRNIDWSRDWSWIYSHIFCLDREDVYRCPKKLLQLGWY
ncbi:unnamed protein product [Urochloa decumbens]|uniref:Interferon-related developmental regulator N-terminal domain-containing protein n=1 Tax=Urochloa decumbens TaxID=240449 RepID=A0ABC9D9Z8_9POAL